MIGITGGIGSGKTTIAKAISAMASLPFYEADEAAKYLMNTQPEIILKLKSLLGAEVYLEGELQRKWLAEKLFSDSSLVKKINAIVHPLVREDYILWQKKQGFKGIYVAALLQEAKKSGAIHHLIVVHAPKELRMQRIQKRDPHRSISQIESIMANQSSDEEMLKNADYVIYNEDSKSVLQQILDCPFLI